MSEVPLYLSPASLSALPGFLWARYPCVSLISSKSCTTNFRQEEMEEEMGETAWKNFLDAAEPPGSITSYD